MTTAELSIVPPTTVEQPTETDLRALKATVGKDCDDAQFRVFTLAAKRLGLDPFARQIVPIVQGPKMTPQVTIDGFRLIAERTGKYAGQLGPQWCGKDGEWRDVWLSDDAPTAARVGVLRRDFDQPMWGVARTAAYKAGTPTWNKMPDVMIAKVAESLALRKAFPQELAGVYTAEEMAQAESACEMPLPLVTVVPTEDDTAAVATAARAKPLPDMPRKEFLQRCMSDLGLDVRQIMQRLGVRTLEGVNLAEAYHLLNMPEATA